MEYTPDSKPLYNKYNVYKALENGGNGPLVEGPTFVLRPYDPHARIALLAYADSVREENAQLAQDLYKLVQDHSG